MNYFPYANRGAGKKKLSCTLALITLLKGFEAAHERIGFKIVAITLITLLKDQGHNNSNYLQFSFPPIILLWKWTLANYNKAFRGTKVNFFHFSMVSNCVMCNVITIALVSSEQQSRLIMPASSRLHLHITFNPVQLFRFGTLYFTEIFISLYILVE